MKREVNPVEEPLDPDAIEFPAGEVARLQAITKELDPTSGSPLTEPGRRSKRLEARKYLHDIQQAAKLISEFTIDRRLEDYHGNAMLRAAVERQFEIIGEALAQLASSMRDWLRPPAIIAASSPSETILIQGYADRRPAGVGRGREQTSSAPPRDRSTVADE